MAEVGVCERLCTVERQGVCGVEYNVTISLQYRTFASRGGTGSRERGLEKRGVDGKQATKRESLLLVHSTGLLHYPFKAAFDPCLA